MIDTILLLFCETEGAPPTAWRSRRRDFDCGGLTFGKQLARSRGRIIQLGGNLRDRFDLIDYSILKLMLYHRSVGLMLDLWVWLRSSSSDINSDDSNSFRSMALKVNVPIGFACTIRLISLIVGCPYMLAIVIAKRSSPCQVD